MPASPSRSDAADGAVDSWLERLSATGNRTAPHDRAQFAYVLSRHEAYYVPRIEFEAVLRQSATGAGPVVRPIDLANLGRVAAYATPVDRTIVRLAGISGVVRHALAAPAPALLAALLELTIETRRLHWQTPESEPLERADFADRLVWRTGGDGRQRPGLAGRPEAVLLPAKPAWYVDPPKGQAGIVDFGIAGDLAAVVAGAPALTPAQAARAQIGWRRAIPERGADPPSAPSAGAFVDEPPEVRLGLSDDGTPSAELRFGYGARIVAAGDPREAFESQAGAQKVVRLRRPDVEQGAAERLVAAGLEPGEGGRFVASPEAWARFAYLTLPELRDSGWHVTGALRSAVVVEPDDDWDVAIKPTEHRWFDVDLGITIDGERIALLPILIEALAQRRPAAQAQEPYFVRLRDGAFAALPAARVARLVDALVELFDDRPLDEQERLPLGPESIGVLDDLLSEAGLRWRGAEALHALLERLKHPPAIVPPAEFRGTLRPYQRHGLAWLQALRDAGFGAVLADDMGLGKTVQLLAHAAVERARGRLAQPMLIVAPTSVIPNWRAEIARFTPEFAVLPLTGPQRAADFERISDADIVLTTYALLRRDAERLHAQPWSLVVLDEAQAVKNPISKGSRYVRALQAEQRIALTGTPIENNLDELWSIFAFVVPQLLGDRPTFGRRFRTPIEKLGDERRRDALAARVRPFLLRRAKAAVESDLPPKSEIVSWVELSGEQRDLYETIRLAMHRRVREELARRGASRSRIVVLDALLKLRQVCCDPRLVKLPAAEGITSSAKLEALLDMLPDLLSDGRRILIFSQFTSMLDLIKPELTQRDMPFVELRGSTRDRQTPVERFQRGEVPLFLISLKAGGTGLNLTAADTVIHYDPWWNPAVERQATDRAHRIGQQKPVFVYRLVSGGTVEQRVLEMQARKAALAEALFGDAATSSLDPESIERLFEP